MNFKNLSKYGNARSVINLSKVNKNAKTVLSLTLMGIILSLTACQTVATKMSDLNMPGFKKELTPEPRYIPELMKGDAEILIISPKRMSCNTQKPMQCMTALIEGNGLNSVFEIPYDGIEGFTPRTNTTYKISARPLVDLTQQKTTGKWVLEGILSQRTVK